MAPFLLYKPLMKQIALTFALLSILLSSQSLHADWFSQFLSLRAKMCKLAFSKQHKQVKREEFNSNFIQTFKTAENTKEIQDSNKNAFKKRLEPYLRKLENEYDDATMKLGMLLYHKADPIRIEEIESKKANLEKTEKALKQGLPKIKAHWEKLKSELEAELFLEQAQLLAYRWSKDESLLPSSPLYRKLLTDTLQANFKRDISPQPILITRELLYNLNISTPTQVAAFRLAMYSGVLPYADPAMAPIYASIKNSLQLRAFQTLIENNFVGLAYYREASRVTSEHQIKQIVRFAQQRGIIISKDFQPYKNARDELIIENFGEYKFVPPYGVKGISLIGKTMLFPTSVKDPYLEKYYDYVYKLGIDYPEIFDLTRLDF